MPRRDADLLIDDIVVLRPKRKPKFKTLNDVARYFAKNFPDCADFPDPPPRPKHHERPILEW